MGLLQNGIWVDQWYETKFKGSRFKRKAPQFRNWITADGVAGPSGKAGFATTQEAYDEAIVPLFGTLDWLEQRLSGQRYLTGATITEADWCLFTTLVWFDPVYVGYFKCNIRRIVDYPNLSEYVRDLYQQPGIEQTVNMAHIKNHSYASHETINPSCVISIGPVLEYTARHDRAELG